MREDAYVGDGYVGVVLEEQRVCHEERYVFLGLLADKQQRVVVDDEVIPYAVMVRGIERQGVRDGDAVLLGKGIVPVGLLPVVAGACKGLLYDK